MAERQTPRGRGALLLEALKKRQESAVGAAAPAPDQPPPPEEPPKPRGRAALLHRLRESKQIGTAVEEPKKVEPTQDAPKTASPPKTSTSAAPTTEVEQITKSLHEVSVSSSSVTFRGTEGRQVDMSANYIRLKTQKDRGVFEYEVRFNPDLDAKNRRIKMVNILLREMGTVKVFDGGSTLYLPQKIIETEKTIRGTLPGIDGDLEVDTTFIYKRKKRFGECLHMYNILFKRIMYILLYNQMGKNYFNPNHKYLIPQHKLEVLPGFAVTVDELEDGLMLCLDTTHRVLRTQNAYELLQELRSVDPARFRDTAASQIIGSCIFTRYNNKTYTVDDIAWDMTPLDTFPTRDGSTISFVDYFKKQHNIVINDVNQPLLINRKPVKVAGQAEKMDRVSALIPEISYLTGMTDAMRSDFKVMKDVAQYTRVTPNQRMQAMRKYIENVRSSEDASRVLSEWGLTIDTGSIELHGRQLDPELICFGKNRTVTSENADWNRAAGENNVTGPIDMLNWIIFHTQRDQKIAKEFNMNMCRLGGVLGCRITEAKMIKLNDDRSESYINACKQNINNSVQIVVFICPTMRSDRYSVIKKMTCSEMPVPSQVINARTLMNQQKVRGITVKIALQMTCKLGGTLWTVRFPFKGWMICGIDTYHSKGSKSVCGFVASINESISRWFSVAMFQDKELGDFYKRAFTKSLEVYRNENGAFPINIVIFRDGVSDGEMDHCKKYEIDQFESVLVQLGIETKLCFIVVQKRINTKMYAQFNNESSNPKPGTIIDTTITKRTQSDFYLVAQSVRQGTVNPTHYVVLHNTTALTPGRIQILAYKLCHLYYNWPGTIKVPAPCQYAHKLAGLVGAHINKLPSQTLCDKLFYL